MMRPIQSFVLVFAGLFSSVGGFAQYPGIDGCNPGPCANATPCRHCTGTWTDNVGYRWNLTTNLATNSVSGTVSVPNPVSGCPNFSFSVSGSITPTAGSYPFTAGSTRMALRTSNPTPASCGGVVPKTGTIDVQLRNDGCDIAAGSARNDDGSWSTTGYSTAKIPDLPSGESTEPVGWWASYPTIQQFRQTLQGDSQRPFDGRQVTEAAGPDRLDGCYYQGAADLGYPQFGVSGGWWIVGRYATPPYYFYTNRWVDDYVGMTPALVQFYRDNGRAPCDSRAQQLMKICTNGQGCTYTQQYRSTYITYRVDQTTVTAGRDNQLASKAWP